MIDTVLNLLFRCSHRHLTRPLTPLVRPGAPRGKTYVACLDCGKKFAYDVKTMQIGKPEEAAPAGKWKYAAWAAVPLGVLAGVILKSRKPGAARRGPQNLSDGVKP